MERGPATVGILGGSSGGYVAELVGMRPHDPATARAIEMIRSFILDQLAARAPAR